MLPQDGDSPRLTNGDVARDERQAGAARPPAAEKNMGGCVGARDACTPPRPLPRVGGPPSPAAAPAREEGRPERRTKKFSTRGVAPLQRGVGAPRVDGPRH